MCGIVGYVGPNADGKALDVVMEGLARLEYRGYDSAGVALVTDDGVVSEKRAGKLVAVTGMSNVLGTMPPLESLAAAAHAVGATWGMMPRLSGYGNRRP